MKLRMKIFILCSFLFTTSSFSQESPDPKKGETLIVRRIVEIWKEGDYKTARNQILYFLEKFPETRWRDQLYGMLGDSYVREERYQDALEAYGELRKDEYLEKTLINRLQCLFSLSEYGKVVDEAQKWLSRPVEKGEKERATYLFAESLFRIGVDCHDGDEKQKIFARAKAAYLSLAHSEFADQTLLPLAEIHIHLGEYPQAANQFLFLAKKCPDKKEEYLFQAASLCARSEKLEAIKLFAKVYQMEGTLAKVAAFNQMLLLFQEEQYADLVTIYPQAMKYIPEEQVPLMHYLIGRSYFALQDYERATEFLLLFAQVQTSPSPQFKSALLHLVHACEKTHSLPSFDRTLSIFREHYGLDPDFTKAALFHARVAAESGELQVARADLAELMERFPNHELGEEVSYIHAELFAQEKKWSESEEAFETFLRTYPNSAKKAAAWHRLVSCHIEDVNGGNVVKKEGLVRVLQKGLAEEDIFSAEERSGYLLLLGKTLYDVEDYRRAKEVLEEHLRGPSPTCDAHYIVALCCIREHLPLKEFIFHAEQALALNPALVGKEELYVQLFNAYLTLSNEGELFAEEKAAGHLYAAACIGKRKVKIDNLLWLADYYSSQLKEGVNCNPALLGRAIGAYEQLLEAKEGEIVPEIEAEMLQLAQLYTAAQQDEQQVHLLERIVQAQGKGDLPWKQQKQTLLMLGKGYQRLTQFGKAMQIYDTLIGNLPPYASYYCMAALLEKTRLQFQRVPSAEKHEENVQLHELLNTLKDLEISKTLSSEPIHLESALTYVECKASLTASPEMFVRKAKLLALVKENFSNLSDDKQKEYHASRTRMPKQDRIYQEYMKFLDVALLITEAEAAKAGAKDAEARELAKVAESQLQQLTLSSPYLQERVQICRETLQKILL